ncbi:MAG: hypothetical protein WC238_01270 [Parcubacteria group bacterium]|jgi:hypothetical protein
MPNGEAVGKTEVLTQELTTLLKTIEGNKPPLKHKVWGQIARAKKLLRRSNGTAHISLRLFNDLKAYE